MRNTINQTRLNITVMTHSLSILHNKVPGADAFHQALLEGCLNCPGLLTAAAVLMVQAAAIHSAVVPASVPRTAK